MARKSKDTNEPLASGDSSQYLLDAEAQNQTEHELAEQAGYSRSRCGGSLRLARENQGLSIQEIASRLRLSPKQIEAIEADNFAALPEATIVRGFIRNYAKQLKVNAEPLLDAYSVLVPSNAPHELTVKPTSSMRVTGYEKPNTGRYIWAGLAVLLGLGVWLFYQNYVEKPNPAKLTASEPAADANSTDLPEPGGALPEPALPVAERAAEPSAATELSLPPAATELSLPPAATPASPANATNLTAAPAVNSGNNAAAPIVPAANPAVPNPPAPVTVTPNSQLVAATTLSAAPADSAATPAKTTSNGKVSLEFSANQETWVNVVDANGKEVYSKIIFAGSRESIDVTPPVNVTVGNAGGTSMSMNGKPVELAPHSRNNVAHIKLNN